MTGMTAQVFFIFAKAENATIIPAEALTRPVPKEDNELGKAYRVSVITKTGPGTAGYPYRLADTHPGRGKGGSRGAQTEILVSRPQGGAAPANNPQRANANRINRGPQL